MNNQESQEREFLHDLASPLGTAIFVLDLVMDDMQGRKDVKFEELMQLGQVYKSLEKIKTMLQKRREALIEQGVESARK